MFELLSQIQLRIDRLREQMAGVVPPWFRERCEERIAELSRQLHRLQIES